MARKSVTGARVVAGGEDGGNRRAMKRSYRAEKTRQASGEAVVSEKVQIERRLRELNQEKVSLLARQQQAANG